MSALFWILISAAILASIAFPLVLVWIARTYGGRDE